MQIDEELLADDIKRTKNYLLRNGRLSSLYYSYDYLGLAQIVYDIFKVNIDNNIFVDNNWKQGTK